MPASHWEGPYSFPSQTAWDCDKQSRGETCFSPPSKFNALCLLSAFCHEEHDILALLGYYTTYSHKSLQTFRDEISPRNVGNELQV
jgi:hypothetical protein